MGFIFENDKLKAHAHSDAHIDVDPHARHFITSHSLVKRDKYENRHAHTKLN